MNDKQIIDFNDALRSRKLTLVCAESITAGLLSSTIASVSGASDVLKGSIVTYSRDLKSTVLKVDPNIIGKFTAESAETTAAMVRGLHNLFPDVNICVAVTGVASSSTETYIVKKDVGQVFVAIIYENKLYEFNTIIPGNSRNEIRQLTVEYILENILVLVKSD